MNEKWRGQAQILGATVLVVLRRNATAPTLCSGWLIVYDVQTREEGKALLRQISQLRALHSSDDMEPRPLPFEPTMTAAIDHTQPRDQATPPNTRISPMYLRFTP